MESNGKAFIVLAGSHEKETIMGAFSDEGVANAYVAELNLHIQNSTDRAWYEDHEFNAHSYAPLDGCYAYIVTIENSGDTTVALGINAALGDKVYLDPHYFVGNKKMRMRARIVAKNEQRAVDIANKYRSLIIENGLFDSVVRFSEVDLRNLRHEEETNKCE